VTVFEPRCIIICIFAEREAKIVQRTLEWTQCCWSWYQQWCAKNKNFSYVIHHTGWPRDKTSQLQVGRSGANFQQWGGGQRQKSSFFHV